MAKYCKQYKTPQERLVTIHLYAGNLQITINIDITKFTQTSIQIILFLKFLTRFKFISKHNGVVHLLYAVPVHPSLCKYMNVVW